MINKTVFIFTKTYPFGRGEEYVTGELKELARIFEKIIVYPNDYYGKGTEHNKEIPENVEILNFNNNLPKTSANNLGDFFYLLKNTFVELIQTDDKKSFFKNFKWNLINFWTQYQLSKPFAEFLKKGNYDSRNSVFYSYWFHKSAILLSILKDKKKINEFVSRAHSVDLYHQDWGIINRKIRVPPFKMFKLKNTSKIYTVSEHGANYLKQKFSKYAGKVACSYLGVTADVINEQKKQISSFCIVSCSGIDYNKRIHKLAEALVEIESPVVWTHFGTGDLLHEVEKYSSKFPANITMVLKGSTPNHEVKKFYAENQIDLFVNLSMVEGLPVSIMEAMAYGIPVLATNVYGTPEAVIEKENGFLLDVNFTKKDLKNKINYCINNPDQLKMMSKASFNLYNKRFNAEKNCTQFANYLASL